MGGVRKRRSRHDPGRTLRDLAVMLADGGDCLADLSALRDQPTLFGDVPSDATAWRALAALDGAAAGGGAARRGRRARARVWELAGAPERVILDLDATLVTAHSDKEQAAGTYKHGFGFHPLLCYEATSEEALAGHPAPGQRRRQHRLPTTSRCSTSRLRSCPRRRSGRVCSSAPTRAAPPTPSSTTSPRSACCFSVGFDLTEPVREAILAVPEQAWRPALTQTGEQREGAAVAELALDLSRWPAGTRAICRRERPHPGAQLSFTDDNGYRFQVFITNQQGRRIERLEQLHRHHAVVEDRIRCGKDTGLANLPFRAFQPNAAWLELVLMRAGPARLDAAAAARRRARPLRAEAAALPAPPRRRPAHPPRPPPPPAPAARLGLGRGAPPRVRAAARAPTSTVGRGQPPANTSTTTGLGLPTTPPRPPRAYPVNHATAPSARRSAPPPRPPPEHTRAPSPE